MITLQNVSRKFGRNDALCDVSFSLEKGKIYGIVGPNGSGKSTTLKLIAGLLFPSKGEVMVNGQKVNRKIAKHVAYLSDLDTFYRGFTVQDMIDFHASQFDDFDHEKVDKLLSFLKLDRYKKLHQLSKGNRARVKLLLVLSRNAPVVLLDEPFSGLDPMVRDTIVEGLLRFIDYENQTVVITTHEVGEMEMLLDEVLLINEGKILSRQSVEVIREREGMSVKEWMKTLCGSEGRE